MTIRYALTRLLRQSRPLFWFYTGGIFLLGALGGAVAAHARIPWESGVFIAAWAWFALGENFFGVFLNDYCDREADRLNPRKTLRWDEALAAWAWALAALSVAAFIAVAYAAGSPVLWVYGGVFFIGNVLYDVPPARLKTRPPFDLLIGASCALPPLFAGYSMVSGEWPPLWAVVVGVGVLALFDFIDKLFDAQADAAAGLTTTATALRLRLGGNTHRRVQWLFALLGTLVAAYVWYLYLT